MSESVWKFAEGRISFGADFAGEIYVIAGSGIYKIVEGS